MKKYLFMLAAALTFTACNSDDEPTMAPTVTENDFESPDGRVVVQLGAEGSAVAAITRAPIKGTAISSLTDLGIFAIARGATFTTDDMTSWATNTEDPHNVLLMNVKATGTENEAFDTSIHKDDEGNALKKISLYAPDANGTAGKVYYYPIQGKQNYDFYGYYPRTGATVAVTDGKFKVSYTNLTGDEDIITGRAVQAPAVDASTIYVKETGKVGQADHTLVKGSGTLNGYNAKYVRSLKYHNWLIDSYRKEEATNKKTFVPNIQFEHRLTKLNFQIITAREQSGASPEGGPQYDNDREEATKLRVKDLKLTKIANDVTLDIESIGTSTELTWGTENATLPIIKENTNNTDVWADDTNIKPQAWSETDTYNSAGYLMVQPKAEYTVTFTVVAPTNEGGIPAEQPITLTFKPNSGEFQAGYSYNVRIALFAMQEVNINAELTDWMEDEENKNIYAPVE